MPNLGVPNPDVLLKHLEASLGQLDDSRSFVDTEGTSLTYLALGQEPAATYATFGLSTHALHSVAGDAVRQELVMTVLERDFALVVLTTLVESILKSHHAIVKGERHRMPGWNQASPIEGVLAVSEPHLPLLFAAEPPVEFLRLLPITAKEARFASEHGPERLAEALRASGVPLDDTFRPGML